MKTKQLFYSAVTLLMMFFAVSCDSTVEINAGCWTEGENKKTNQTTDADQTTDTNANQTVDNVKIDYTDYISGNYSIKVKNETGKQLVAFKGSPSEENLISGIPANATNHGLKLEPTLFKSSSDFVLFVVEASAYKENIKDLSALQNQPFTRLYAYYNDNAKNNNNLYTISKQLGGNSKITLFNSTRYNVELRRDGLYGEPIGYIGSDTHNLTLNVEAGDYYLFPVFRKFDKASGEIISAYPKYTSGKGKGRAMVEAFSLDNETTEIELSADKWIESAEFSASASYLKIVNSSSNGISLYEGQNTSAVLTSTGGKIINSGKEFVFQIDMTDLGEDTYSDFKETSQYHVKSPIGGDPAYITGSSDTKFKFYAGKMYTATVTGDTVYDLKCELVKDASGDPVADDVTF